jgi:3-methyladenine DNA glycosylase AlkD
MPYPDIDRSAARIVSQLDSPAVQNASGIRRIRRSYSRILRKEEPEYILQIARKICDKGKYRWFAYELIQNHKSAFALLDGKWLTALGRGIDSWWTVDAFARILSGPAWLHRQIPDRLILQWAHSDDRWWRRAALVSTVALNVRSQGGTGDIPRTLKVCRRLASDRDDMVVKAMSWSLRALVVHDPGSVKNFLRAHEGVLAPRIRREVGNKLRTGLKNPGRPQGTRKG